MDLETRGHDDRMCSDHMHKWTRPDWRERAGHLNRVEREPPLFSVSRSVRQAVVRRRRLLRKMPTVLQRKSWHAATLSQRRGPLRRIPVSRDIRRLQIGDDCHDPLNQAAVPGERCGASQLAAASAMLCRCCPCQYRIETTHTSHLAADRRIQKNADVQDGR